MEQEPNPSTLQEENDPRSSVNEVASAAFLLGYYSRAFWLDSLERIIPALVDEIQQNAFIGMQRLLLQLNIVLRHSEKTKGRPGETSTFLGHGLWTNDLDLIELSAFRLFADRAVRHTSECRKWYDFGAALGDYELDLRMRDGTESLPDPASVVKSIRRLPKVVVMENPAIRKFIELDLDTVDPVDILRGTSAEMVGHGSSTGWLRPSKQQAARELVQVIVLQVGQIHHLDIPLRDDARDARDQWLYDEACKGTPWKSLVRALSKKPLEWTRMDSVNGIKAAVKRYAERTGKPKPSRRQAGRPPRLN